MRRKSRDLRMR